MKVTDAPARPVDELTGCCDMSLVEASAWPYRDLVGAKRSFRIQTRIFQIRAWPYQ